LEEAWEAAMEVAQEEAPTPEGCQEASKAAMMCTQIGVSVKRVAVLAVSWLKGTAA
jgi:hypothetical protein